MKKLVYLIILVLILGLALTGCLSKVSQVPAIEPELPQGENRESDPFYDMTTDGTEAVEEATINDAIWKTLPSTQPTGSGVFYAFLRVQASPSERGYNTDRRPLQFDENTSATFTHSFYLNDVPQIEIGGVIYREFQLDINEASSTPYISLDEFQVWTTNDPNLSEYNEAASSFPTGTSTGQALLVYDLDGDENTWIKMDYRWNTGSGKRDYRVLILESDFAGKDLEYVVIFTRHGDHNASDDGFEEWGVEIYLATKLGSKFNDVNGNGEWDEGEPGLSGWTIYVDYDGDGVCDAGEPYAVTGADGSYRITGIEPGIYDVREVPQENWECTYPEPGYYPAEEFGNGAYVMGNNFGNFLGIPNTLVTILADKTTVYSGDPVVLTVKEKNTGDVPLTSPYVDLLPLGYTLNKASPYYDSGDAGTIGVLDVGETWTWIVTGVTVNADTTFTATGHGLDPQSNDVTYPEYPEEQDSVLVETITPAISIEKTVDCNDDGEFLDTDYGYAGDIGHWRIVVTNTGDSPLTNAMVTDTNGMSFGPFDLPNPGDTAQFDYDMPVPVTITNEATVVATEAMGGTVTATDDATNVVISPDISIEKTVDCNDDGEFLDTDYGYAGDIGHWRIVVTNTGDSPLTNAMVTDTNGMSFGPFDLPNPGDTAQFDYDMPVPVTITNEATVVATEAMGGTVTATDDATNVVISPDISIEKTVDCNDDGEFLDTDYGYAGDIGHWRIVVTNTGDSPLTNAMVTDTNGMSFGPFDLPNPGDTAQFDYDMPVPVTITNEATVVATEAMGGTVTATDDATNVVISPDISIEKTVDCNDDGEFLDTDYGYAGDIGHWRIVVTNTGDSPLTNAMVTDTNGMSFGPFDLPNPGDTAQFDYDMPVPVTITNEATVVATEAMGGTVTATDDATNVVISPDISIEKTVDCNDDGEFLDTDYGYAGDIGHWRIVVTNTGDSPLTNAMVTDTNGMSFGPFDLPNPGDTAQFDYDMPVPVTITNEATVVATEAMGGTVTATDDATNVVISPDISIEKTVDCNDDGEFLDTDYGYAGDIGHWRIVVTNTGDSPLTNAMVTDTNGMSFGPFDLPNPGDTAQFDYDMPVPVTITNEATVVATEAMGGTVTATDDATNVVISPDISIEKTVDCNDDGEFLDTDYGYAGDIGHWRIVVTNTGDSPLTNAMVTDTNGMSFGPFDLPNPGDTAQFDYDMPVPVTITNEATVVATEAMGGTVTATDDATNVVISPDISIEKTVDCNDDGEFLDTDYGYAGDIGHWRIVVTNTGDSPLTNAMVTDTNGMSFGPFDLPNPGDTAQFDYDMPVPVTITNEATVVATEAMGGTVTATDDATNVVISPDISIEKTVDCNDDGEFLDTDYGYAGDIGHWRIVVTNTGDSPLTNAMVTDTNGMSFGPFDLPNPGDTAQFDYDMPVPVTITNEATVVATEAMGGTVTATDDATNVVISPDTLVSITPNVWETTPGENVILTITEKNTGDVDLTSPSVDLYDGTSTVSYDNTSPEFVAASDTDGDGELDVGEIWEWSVQTTISTTTTFTATGHGTDPLGNDVTYPQYPREQAEATVETGAATRTLGFWKTHLIFTEYVFDFYLGGNIDLGWKQIDSMEKMMGIFWANVAKESDGSSKRKALCKARVQASWQAIAAILNSSMPGGAPLPSGVTLESIKITLNSTSVGAIKALASQLDAYNMSGDDVALDPSLLPTGKADPNGARDIANIPFADCL